MFCLGSWPISIHATLHSASGLTWTSIATLLMCCWKLPRAYTNWWLCCPPMSSPSSSRRNCYGRGKVSSMYICTYVHTCTYIHVHVEEKVEERSVVKVSCMYKCKGKLELHTYYLCTYVCTCIHACELHVRTCVHACVYTDVHTYSNM